MLTAIKSVAELDALECEIQEEEKKLALLKDSLEQAEGLTRRMIKMLEDFDDRIAELDPIIMPIFRGVQAMTLVKGNVESTLDVLKLIEGFNQLAEEEEDALHREVSLEGVPDFLSSLNKVSDAITEMERSKLDFCVVTKERLVKLRESGTERLLACFQSGLEELSSEVGEAEDNLGGESLKLISGFAIASSTEMYERVLAAYAQVRSQTLQRSMSSSTALLWEALNSGAVGHSSYQRGSHVYLQTLNQLVAGMAAESRFAMRVLPSGDAVLPRLMKGSVEEWNRLTQTLCGQVVKAVERGEWAEQIFIFDLIGSSRQLAASHPAELAVLEGALRPLLATGKLFLERVSRETELEAKQGSALPTPSSAAVFELTSSLMNCLRRMVEYAPVLEEILSPGGTSQELPCLAAYYQQALRSLEAAIELRAKSYRKSIAGLVFRLNNYRHVQRALSSSSYVADLLPPDYPEHFSQVLQQLKEQYATSWKSVARLLDASEQLSGSIGMASTTKDRAKIFINELSEAVKLQSGLAVPDPEFRLSLREIAKNILLPVFEEFYSNNTTIFLAMASKGTDFNKETLSSEIAKLFSSS